MKKAGSAAAGWFGLASSSHLQRQARRSCLAGRYKMELWLVYKHMLHALLQQALFVSHGILCSPMHCLCTWAAGAVGRGHLRLQPHAAIGPSPQGCAISERHATGGSAAHHSDSKHVVCIARSCRPIRPPRHQLLGSYQPRLMLTQHERGMLHCDRLYKAAACSQGVRHAGAVGQEGPTQPAAGGQLPAAAQDPLRTPGDASQAGSRS